MSWSDLFYPGNPERREKIIRRSQELIELMKNNFRVTNSLSEIVNEHLGSSFRPIALKEKATVKENCDVMIERVKKIQAIVEVNDEELKKNLEPSLYEGLHTMTPRSQSFNKVKKSLTAVCHISAALLVRYLMTNGIILCNLTSTCARIAGGCFATLVIGVLLDMIVSAIVGCIERAELEKTLAEYDATLAEFRPASEKYQKAIFKLEIILEYLKKE